MANNLVRRRARAQYRIDRSNPLARGLKIAVVAGIPVNLCDNSPLTFVNSNTPTLSQSQGVRVTDTGGYQATAPTSASSPEAKYDVGNSTALVVGRQTSNANSCVMFCRGNGSTGPVWGVGMYSGSANGPLGWFGATSNTPLNADTTLNRDMNCAVASGNGSTMKIYWNGLLHQSLAYTPATVEYSPSTLRRVMFGSVSHTGVATTGQPAIGLWWDRVLSDAEVRLISADPWQVFAAQRKVNAAVSSATYGATRKNITRAKQPQQALKINPYWLSKGLRSVIMDNKLVYGKTISYPTASVNNSMSVGAAGRAISFSGTGYIQYADAVLSSAPCTRLAVIRPTDLSGGSTISSPGGGLSDIQFRVASGYVQTLLSGVSQIVSTSAPVISAGQLSTVGAICSSGRNEVWANGKLAASNSTTYGSTTAGTGWVIGARNTSVGEPFSGDIFLHIDFASPLSQADMQKLMNNPWQVFTPSTRRLAFATGVSSGGTTDGVGSSTAAATGSGVGQSTNTSVGSSAGTGLGSGVGSTGGSISSATASSTAAGAGAGVGSALIGSSAASSAVGAASGAALSLSGSTASSVAAAASAAAAQWIASVVAATSAAASGSGVGANGSSTPQYARPASDAAAGSWFSSLGGALSAAIDETVFDDGDYIKDCVPSVARVNLGAVTDPVSSSGHIVRYRAWSPSGGNLTVRLKQGATLIASWTHTGLSGTPATYAQTLTGVQADSITDYTALSVELEAA